MLRHIVLWKYGIAVAVILGLSIYVSHQDQKTREQYEQKCSQLNARSVPPSAHREDCEKGAENAARHLPRWYRVFGWPEGITTWAILLTLLTISEQTSATRRAADATLRSVKLQEAGMSQWIDVEPLGCYIQEPRVGVRDFPFTINLRFEAVNNTAYPFDIQRIVTKIGMMPGEWEVFAVETSVSLSPQEKSPSRRYAFYVPTQSITEEWFKRGTIVTINGEITFKNCLNRTQTDYFGGLYRCGQIDSGQQGMFRYMEALGLVPDRTKEEDQPQNPN